MIKPCGQAKLNLRACVCHVVWLLVATAVAGEPWKAPGYQEAFNMGPDQVAKDYAVQEIASTGRSNVFWPGEDVSLTFQFVNKTAAPLKGDGKAELVSYGFSTDPADVFQNRMHKIADLGATPFALDLLPNGFQNVVIKPNVPAKLGAYLLLIDVAGHGRQFGAAFLRTPVATPGKVHHPSYALDINGWNCVPEVFALWQRLGIKATRLEYGARRTTGDDFAEQMADLGRIMAGLADYDITVMLTLSNTGYPQPLNTSPRYWLNEQDETVSNPQKGDMAGLPEFDEDFQRWCALVAGTFGWPRGPLNGMELWNEPWEGISISGWGADVLRFRELYTAMAQGVEQARKKRGVQVLIGGACSSMNTDDKLFCDGTDTFLKWLDFTSIHYQPLAAMPALVPEWMTRKSPLGPTRVWDTESWIANSEDRVAAVIASMRSLGQERTAGVFHDMVYGVQRYDMRLPNGTAKIRVVQAWAPGGAIAAVQNFIGERRFKEILFKNGLPWVYVFDGLPKTVNNKAVANPDDGTVVVVGDLSGVYDRDRLLFRSVLGTKNVPKVAEAKARLAALPADAPRAERQKLQKALRLAAVLDDAALALSDGGGCFLLSDYYGNAVPAQGGKIVVPLNGLGYMLRTDGSAGSFAQLIDALKAARIDGLTPLDVRAHDLLARVEQQPALRLTLTNILNRPVSGELTVTLGELQLEAPPKPLAFEAHETKEVALKVTGGKSVASNTYPLKLIFDAGADGRTALEENLHVNVIPRKTIAVDGDLKDWEGVLPQPITGGGATSANLTEKAWLPFMQFDEKTSGGVATGFMAYDDNGFYFAAKIADDSPYDGNVRFAKRDDDQYFYPEKSFQLERDKQGAVKNKRELKWPEGVRRYSYRKDPDIPSGEGTDNVQLAFGVFAPGQNGMYAFPPGTMPRYMAWKCTDYEFALNQVAQKYGGGTEIWRLTAPGLPRKHFYPRQPKAAVDGGPVENGKLAMKRDGNTRIVEAMLPWSEIPEVKKRLDAGQAVRFTFRANNNKGAALELCAERSVSQVNINALHNYWSDKWAAELEFLFEK